jgi:CDGSH-type Zn-finger protein
MDKPTIAERSPAVMELKPGESYWWCRCGRSKNQPFCDGSHAGTSFRPMEFTVSEARTYALCRCKHTAGSPFCDGTHKRLPAPGAAE